MHADWPFCSIVVGASEALAERRCWVPGWDNALSCFVFVQVLQLSPSNMEVQMGARFLDSVTSAVTAAFACDVHACARLWPKH